MKPAGMLGDAGGAKGWTALLVVLVAIIFAIRMAGPNDLEADAQDRNVGYVMDVVWQGHWLVQTDIRDRIMSKPPLHTWIASSMASIGGINRVTLSLPSALAVLGMALTVFYVGRQRFGQLAGGMAGLAVVLAPIMSRHIALVRTDALFALTITLAAFAAHRAWERGGGWIPFWLAAAAATLVKGPLGLILAAAGLLAWFWEHRSNPAAPPPRGKQATGIALFLVLTLGWLLLGAAAEGYKLIDKLIFGELLAQSTGLRKDITPGENFYKPSFFFALRFLPFSLFAGYGLWRVVRHPAVAETDRRFERFLFCWVAIGLLIFSLAAHFRADLLLPLWPPAALLAGREMARFGERFGTRRLAAGTVLLAAAMVGAMVWNYLIKDARFSKEVRYTQHAEAAAHALAQSGLDVRRIQHLDTPVTLQLGLGTFNVWIEEEEALRLARRSEPVLLAIEAPNNFKKLFAPDGPVLHKVFEAPGLTVYSNSTTP